MSFRVSSVEIALMMGSADRPGPKRSRGISRSDVPVRLSSARMGAGDLTTLDAEEKAGPAAVEDGPPQLFQHFLPCVCTSSECHHAIGMIDVLPIQRGFILQCVTPPGSHDDRTPSLLSPMPPACTYSLSQLASVATIEPQWPNLRADGLGPFNRAPTGWGAVEVCSRCSVAGQDLIKETRLSQGTTISIFHESST